MAKFTLSTTVKYPSFERDLPVFDDLSAEEVGILIKGMLAGRKDLTSALITIVKQTFTVYGNWGTLCCDAETGMVISYDHSDSDWEKPGDGYEDIVRMDINEWRQHYPGQDITKYPRDIIAFGFWTTDGYTPPERSFED